jgi:SPP1 gp7 family putative phage head morphogenesis protein
MKASEILAAPFNWVKSQFPKLNSSQQKLQAALVGHDPTAGYQGLPNYPYATIVNSIPPYTLFDGKMMLDTDPVVEFGLNIRNAALSVAEVEITAKNEQVKKWLDDQWRVIWELNRGKILATKKWGFNGLQPTYKMNPATRMIEIEGLKDFAPEDMKALRNKKSGNPCGFKVRGRELYGPRALWLTFNAEYGSPYGKGVLRRMWPPWFKKWMPHGAEKLTQLRMIKDAYIGDIFWYPPNMNLTINGQEVPWRDVLRQQGENRLSGGALTMPMLIDNNGKDLTRYTPPQHIPGATDIFQWRESIDEDILRAADIPIEVVKASETGSGYSGRSIPFMVLLSVCNEELTCYVQAIEQLLRDVAWLNWGSDPDFELRPKSLVESFAQDASGSPMGGGAIGGQPGQGGNGQPGGMQGGGAMTGAMQPGGRMAGGGQRFAEGETEPTIHQFSSTQFNLPGELAFQLRQVGDRINFDDLAEDGRELNPHITVKYGLHTNDAEEVRRAVQDSAPIAVTFGKTSTFPGSEHDVVKIEIESQGLRDLNAAISEKLHCTDTYPDYKPHCTIAYVKPGMGETYAAALNDLQGKVAVFDRLIFSDKTGTHTSIPLLGTSTRFEEPAPSSQDDITAIGTAAARARIRAAADAIRALLDDPQKKTAELTDPFNPLGTFDSFALLTDIETLIESLSRGISSDLQASMLAGQLSGAAEVAVSVPPALTPPAAPVGPPGIPPAPPTLAALFPDEPPPDLFFPVLDDAVQVLESSEVFTSNDYRQVAEEVRRGAFGITSDLEAKAVADVRDILQENIAKGANLEEFTEAVVARLEVEGPLSEAHIETIFRTNVNAAFSNGANKSLEQPMVSDAFPYRAYFATTDQRVRPEHAAMERHGLNGTNIYRADDPTWFKFRPPFDYNCRCSWTPVSVEQAARRGVQEAQAWWERARMVRDEQFNGEGRIVEYLNRTAPSEREWVAPPPFEPSPEFARFTEDFEQKHPRNEDGEFVEKNKAVSAEARRLANQRNKHSKEKFAAKVAQSARELGVTPEELMEAIVGKGKEDADKRNAIKAAAAKNMAKEQAEDKETEAIVSDVESQLLSAGWKLEYKSESGSKYYVAPNGIKLRLSNHVVPLTSERIDTRQGSHPWEHDWAVDSLRVAKGLKNDLPAIIESGRPKAEE